MDFCSNCGDKTDPDWVFCRSCGGVLEDDADGDLVAPIPRTSGVPKVELISRGWDVIDVEALDTTLEELDDDVLAAPLPPQTVEVTVDDVTVVETVEAPATAEEIDPAAASDDGWAHLRPGGEVPPLLKAVSRRARIGQVALWLSALTALVSAALHFYHNTRLSGLGQTTAETLHGLEQIAQTSRYVVAGTVLLALATLGFWFIEARPTADFRPGKAGVAALASFLAACLIVAGSLAISQSTTAKVIGFNSLMVLGLGLLMAACLAAAHTVERIDLREPA